MKPNTRHLRPRLPRLLPIAVAIGTIIAWFAVAPPAQSEGIDPEPVCAGQPPGQNPCGTILLKCSEKGKPCNSRRITDYWWYCCYEDNSKTPCRYFQGWYVCCNGVWKEECHEIGRASNCGSDGHCFG
ncbi:MAG: hypothetical protein C4341_10145 [Armatimonadota bacterium]